MFSLLRFILVALAGVVAFVTLKDLISRALDQLGVVDSIWNTLFVVGVPL